MNPQIKEWIKLFLYYDENNLCIMEDPMNPINYEKLGGINWYDIPIFLITSGPMNTWTLSTKFPFPDQSFLILKHCKPDYQDNLEILPRKIGKLGNWKEAILFFKYFNKTCRTLAGKSLVRTLYQKPTSALAKRVLSQIED